MKTGQVHGQEVMPGMTNPDRFRLSAQIAFSGLVTPEQWGLNPDDYADITPEMMTLLAPDILQRSLIDLPARSPCAVSYRDGETGLFRLIALTPTEYGLISRNVEKLGESAVNKTLAARPLREDFSPDTAAAERAGVHTLERYVQGMEAYTAGTLEKDLERIKRLEEYVKHMNLRRLKGLDMRIELEWVRSHVFGDIFIALRRQRNWTPEQDDRARRTLDKRLFFDRNYNRHLTNWREMLAFSEEYTGHKWALFKTKIREAKSYSAKHDQSVR